MGRTVVGASLCVALLWAAAEVPAAIRFAGSAAERLPAAAESIATGDLDGDGHLDAVLVGGGGRELMILRAAERPSGLTPPQRLVFGASLRRAAVGDVNGDARADVVVADRGGALWLLIGRGDGTFQTPERIALGGGPVAVALADFDGGGNRDLVVADVRHNSATVLLNDGAAMPSFRSAATIAVGESPDEVLAVDVDRDARPDVVTLNLGGGRLKEIAVSRLLDAGGGALRFAPAERTAAGERPSHLVAAELTGDGAADLALLSRRGGSNDALLVLVNDGSGRFRAATSALPCPFFTGGIPCRAQALAAADVDRNNRIDLAVAFTDPRTVAGPAPPRDALQIFSGRGDGTFVPGGVFALPESPSALAAGNATGDCLPDLFAAARRDPSLLVLVNASTPGLDLHGNGAECLAPGECVSGLCADGVCCATVCAAGERCHFPGSEGLCRPIPPPLRPCSIDRNCPDAAYPFCADGVCCDAECATGRCDLPGAEGICIPGAAPGVPCGDDRECASGFCTTFRCCRERCAEGYCDTGGLCHPLRAAADPCGADAECQSGICDTFDGICCNRRCEDLDSFCMSDGRCAPRMARNTGRLDEEPNPVLRSSFPPCGSADCDGDGAIAINELVRLVGVALGSRDPGPCPAADPTLARCVSISEIVLAVKQALGGCGVS